jgi:hypothetical protein
VNSFLESSVNPCGLGLFFVGIFFFKSVFESYGSFSICLAYLYLLGSIMLGHMCLEIYLFLLDF